VTIRFCGKCNVLAVRRKTRHDGAHIGRGQAHSGPTMRWRALQIAASDENNLLSGSVRETLQDIDLLRRMGKRCCE
jgi:hypothetical protein